MENSFFKPNQSGKRRVSFAFILAVALGGWVRTELRAQVVVVPNDLATNNGNATVNISPGSGVVTRYMMMHEASEFAALSGPSLLTGFAFRPKEATSPTGPRVVTLKLYASTTKGSVDQMSTTFSQNIGTNNTLVFEGTLMLDSDNLPGPGDTRRFDVVTSFTTPFLYDPAEGNLVLDFQMSSDSGQAFDFDGVTENPAIRSLLNLNSATAASGFFSKPQVTQFTFEAPTLVTIRTSQVEVCWNSQSNLTYQVQYRSDLTLNLWTSLGVCIRSTNSTSCVFDSLVVGQPQRFYRVVQTNCVPQL